GTGDGATARGAIAAAGACCAGGAPSGVPHDAQKRLPVGLLVPQRAQVMPTGWASGRGDRSNSGAGGRLRTMRGSEGRAACTATGAGATGATAATNRLPQSWQNRRLSGFSRPQRLHFTPTGERVRSISSRAG